MHLTENLGGTPKNGLHRRRFIKGMAATAGLGVGASILAACGDSPTNTAAPIPTTAAAATTAAPTTAASTTAAATTAAATTAAATTAAPTTAASTTVAATTAAPTTAAPTTAAATTAAATTAAQTTAAGGTTAAASGTAPAGYVEVAKFAATSTNPVSFTSGSTKGYVYSKSATEVYVYSNVCTHMGCEVPAYKAADNAFTCPCHGSTFTNTGEVTKGPAKTRLPLFDNKVVGDVIYAKLS